MPSQSLSLSLRFTCHTGKLRALRCAPNEDCGVTVYCFSSTLQCGPCASTDRAHRRQRPHNQSYCFHLPASNRDRESRRRDPCDRADDHAATRRAHKNYARVGVVVAIHQYIKAVYAALGLVLIKPLVKARLVLSRPFGLTHLAREQSTSEWTNFAASFRTTLRASCVPVIRRRPMAGKLKNCAHLAPTRHAATAEFWSEPDFLSGGAKRSKRRPTCARFLDFEMTRKLACSWNATMLPQCLPLRLLHGETELNSWVFSRHPCVATRPRRGIG